MTIDITPNAEDDLPLFDARYRWVLLFAMRHLRETPDIDLDDIALFDATYGFLSTFGREFVRARRLASRLDPMRVSAISQSGTARTTVIDLLMMWQKARSEHPSWRTFMATETAILRMNDGVHSADPTLSLAEIERRALEKRNGFAQNFGLRARIGDVVIETSGKVRIPIEIEDEVTLKIAPLLALSINGVEHLGGELQAVQKINEAKVKARAVVMVDVPPVKLGSVRALPLSVRLLTSEDVRIEAFKMA